MKILHVCNSFDPSADVIRCVKELNKYSRHTHALIVHDPHPVPAYEFEQAPHTEDYEARGWFDWADAVIYQFVGYERGWGILPNKPVAFRNINIYYDKAKDKFWSESYFNATDLSPYKLTASSHMGASDFLPNFRLLPDLLPIFDEAYLPDWSHREPCVSYIKHADELDKVDFGFKTLNLNQQPHHTVLSRRQKEATCVIDNVCDGHAGLAGMEAMSLGLTTIVYNHGMELGWFSELAPHYPPFIQVTDLESAVKAAIEYRDDLTYRTRSRSWMVACYNSQRLIDMYWDPFVEELLG